MQMAKCGPGPGLGTRMRQQTRMSACVRVPHVKLQAVTPRCASRPRLVVRAAAAAAAAAPPAGSWGGPPAVHTVPERYPAVAPLPPPPSSATLFRVLPYLANLALSEKQLSWRLGVAFMCMVTSKAAGLCGPIFLKGAVDALGAAGTAAGVTALVPTVRAICAFGLAGVLQHVAKELQHPTFTPVSQAVSRRVAYHTFAHVLDMDIAFHLERRTGRLSRILERGTRSISSLYRAVLFTFAPTAVELVFVTGLLAARFSPLVAGLVGATFLTYVTWTLSVTQLAVEVRKQVNTLDNLTTSKAVDALLNAETVALFNNQALEVTQYDTYLRGFQNVAIQTERLSALLNAGQAIILSVGLTLVLIAAVVCNPSATPAAAAAAAGAAAAGAAGVAAGGAGGLMGSGLSPGDLVMIQGLLLQLWAPLQFLGWFYRELRQSLVDMEEFFDILATRSNLPDGTKPLPDTYTPPAAAVAAAAAAATTSMASANGHIAQQHAGSTGEDASSSSNEAQAEASAAARERLLSHYAASSSSNGNGNGNGLSSSSSHDQHHLHPQQLMPDHHSPHTSMDEFTGSLESQATLSDDSDSESAARGVRVDLKDVTFGYHPDRQVLKGVTLTAASGKSLAVVGSSGSGKSTILKLVTRLYDVRGGSVEVNGLDVREVVRDSLRSAVAVVPQDTVLFNDTILNNIRYGKPGASDEEVIAAAEMAHLHAAVLRMPDGYATVVGERGLKLSGGEKQRVAIARAFLRAPRLLICDEATSALDSATEASIMTSLRELAKGRTSIFVAHRLSTIKGCDHIVVLAAGRVAEQGTHAQLMARGGVYADMWAMQVAEAQQRSQSGAGGGVTIDDGGVTSSGEEVEAAAAMTPLPSLSARTM